ncbi:(Z)-3-hexen-1-ol acetyltransferase [Frankliniella fusca]|uniref:(Z)-3-hexen-1-ol acetyltransferase n=1 Tax=Frankliniella fusca TaxID=407009 RepID=A0AAE1HK06_9NEOP|nr:(Z)-3-hexen-1-ol acetyltransferase [Frankliniella fusca]
MLAKFQSIGVTPEDAKRIEFVTDWGGGGGANIVNALIEFKWNYCLGHALNLCEKGTFTVNYYDLVGRALENNPEAKSLVTTCDQYVRAVTAAIARKKKGIGKGLHVSNWSTHSHLEEHLEQRQYEGLMEVRDVVNDDVRALVILLGPFDNGGTRETSPHVTPAVWPALLDHLEPANDDSLSIVCMKDTIRSELVRMEAVALIEKCKDFVFFFLFKSSPGLKGKLTKLGCTTLKQEVPTRWNSHLTLLRSIQGKMDMINHVLREHSAATGKPHLTRTEGISNELIDALVAFLSPFEQTLSTP